MEMEHGPLVTVPRGQSSEGDTTCPSLDMSCGTGVPCEGPPGARPITTVLSADSAVQEALLETQVGVWAFVPEAERGPDMGEEVDVQGPVAAEGPGPLRA